MAWPATLPKLALTENYGETVPDGSYRTQTDSGPGKTRPKPDDPNETREFTQFVTSDQIETLKTFYKVGLSKGSQPFEEFDPRTGENVMFRFRGGIRFGKASGRLFTAQFTLEIIS